MRQHGLDAVDDALHVVAPHRIEVVVDEVGDGARDAATGVVDPHVDAPEALDRRLGEVLDVAALRDVGDDRERVLADRRGDRVELRLAARREDDLRALGRELLRELGPDARARARDDDDLVHAPSV